MFNNEAMSKKENSFNKSCRKLNFKQNDINWMYIMLQIYQAIVDNKFGPINVQKPLYFEIL